MRKPLEEFIFTEVTVMRIVQNHRVRKNTKMPLVVEKCIRQFVRKSQPSVDCRTVKIKLLQDYNGNIWRIRIFEREKPVQKYTYDDYIQENG